MNRERINSKISFRKKSIFQSHIKFVAILSMELHNFLDNISLIKILSLYKSMKVELSKKSIAYKLFYIGTYILT